MNHSLIHIYIYNPEMSTQDPPLMPNPPICTATKRHDAGHVRKVNYVAKCNVPLITPPFFAPQFQFSTISDFASRKELLLN